MDRCDCHDGDCRLCGRPVATENAGQLIAELLAVIDHADDMMVQGWLTREQRDLIDAARRVVGG